MERITKYQVVVANDGRLLVCKSFYNLEDAKRYYEENLKEKYPKDKYKVYYSQYTTCE